MGAINLLRRTPALLALAATVGSAMYSGFPSAGDVILKPTTAAITAAGSPNAMSAPGVRTVSLFPAASDLLREGFVRMINRSDQASEVTVAAVDDGGNRLAGAVLAIGASETVHFNSQDLESGNPAKGLSGSTGASGSDDWRLALASDLGIEVLAYLRSTDGFLTTMHDVVERGLIGHRVATFTPGGTGTRSACCG